MSSKQQYKHGATVRAKETLGGVVAGEEYIVDQLTSGMQLHLLDHDDKGVSYLFSDFDVIKDPDGNEPVEAEPFVSRLDREDGGMRAEVTGGPEPITED